MASTLLTTVKLLVLLRFSSDMAVLTGLQRSGTDHLAKGTFPDQVNDMVVLHSAQLNQLKCYKHTARLVELNSASACMYMQER